MQLCTQVKRRTIPDRIHTTVPSAFEFPASRKTFHELGSSSLDEMKLCVLDVEAMARALAKDVEHEWAFDATYARGRWA